MGHTVHMLLPPVNKTLACVSVEEEIIPVQESRKLRIDMVGLHQDVNVDLINVLNDRLKKVPS